MAQKNLKHLTLLHSNDMHGDFLAEEIDNELVGGVSLLSGYVTRSGEIPPIPFTMDRRGHCSEALYRYGIQGNLHHRES